MPGITVDISNDTVARLNLEVADHNARNGASLDLDAWLQLRLRELAVQREFSTRVESLKKQADDDPTAAIDAEKARLLRSATEGASA